MAVVNKTDTQLLSDIRLERVAAAFELPVSEVRADVASVVRWSGRPSELEAVLSARHGWASDEAFYFVQCVRLGLWCTSNGLPDSPRSIPNR